MEGIWLPGGNKWRKDKEHEYLGQVLPRIIQSDEVMPAIVEAIAAMKNQYHSAKGDKRDWHMILSLFQSIKEDLLGISRSPLLEIPGLPPRRRGQRSVKALPPIIADTGVLLTPDVIEKVTPGLEHGYRHDQLTPGRAEAIITPLHWAWLEVSREPLL